MIIWSIYIYISYMDRIRSSKDHVESYMCLNIIINWHIYMLSSSDHKYMIHINNIHHYLSTNVWFLYDHVEFITIYEAYTNIYGPYERNMSSTLLLRHDPTKVWQISRSLLDTLSIRLSIWSWRASTIYVSRPALFTAKPYHNNYRDVIMQIWSYMIMIYIVMF